MFSAVPRASGPVFMFCAPGLIFGGLSAPRLVFSGTEGFGSHFHLLRSRTNFRRYRGRRVPFPCFARTDSFSTVPNVSGLVFMVCAPGLVFGDGTEGVLSRFDVFYSRTCFRRYRGRWVPFSCFVLPDYFSAVSNASGPVFIFCPPGLIFGSIEGVRSHFYVLRARTRFRRYQGRRVPFSFFGRLDIFSTVRRASGPVFRSFVPRHIFGGNEGVESRFHVLFSRIQFRRF
jgi:hypothetical protein